MSLCFWCAAVWRPPCTLCRPGHVSLLMSILLETRDSDMGLQLKRWGRWLHFPFSLSRTPTLPPSSTTPPSVFPGLSVDLRQMVWQRPRLSRKTRGLKAHKFHAVQHANVPSADKRAFNPATLLLSTLLPLSLLSLCHSPSFFFLLFNLFFYVCLCCVALYCIKPHLYSTSPCLLYSFLLYLLLYFSLILSFSLTPQPTPPWHPLAVLAGPCALWSSLRCPSMAATDPTWRPPRLAPIWPRSWRSTPRCPSITQASMLKCSGSACLLQRCPPAKPHPKPLKVRFLLYTSCFCGPIEY